MKSHFLALDSLRTTGTGLWVNRLGSPPVRSVIMRRCVRCSCLIRCCSPRPIPPRCCRFSSECQRTLRYLSRASLDMAECALRSMRPADARIFPYAARRASNTRWVTCAQVVGANARRLIQNLKVGTRELSRCYAAAECSSLDSILRFMGFRIML